MAPHNLLLSKYCGAFYFGGDIILTNEDVINITLEGKQSAKAKMLIDLLYDDSSYLYDLAEHFQDEQRYTVALLSDVLSKISLRELATMGFREGYLNSLLILDRSNDDLDNYINKLIKEKDLTAIDIAIIILEKEDIDITKLIEERNNI